MAARSFAVYFFDVFESYFGVATRVEEGAIEGGAS